MIKTKFKIDLQGKAYDALIKARADIGDRGSIIEFPAPYAAYAFTSHGRNVFDDSIIRRHAAILSDFRKMYDDTFSIRRSIIYVARQHLNAMRKFELNAPGLKPPAINPHANRLRRVTGRLSDTATIPRGRDPEALPSSVDRDVGRLTKKTKGKLKRRFRRSGDFTLKIGTDYEGYRMRSKKPKL